MIAINKNPLSKLSDSQIIKRLDALVQKERQTTLDIIRHLIEMDRRKLHLGRGYGSLYEYSTLHLGYSKSAAMRRIRTARCIRDFPEIFEMLEKNELNLTSICMLDGIMNEANKKEVLKEARFKSKRQIEEIIARYKPGKELKDRVRTIFVKTVREVAANTNASNANASGICSPPDNSSKPNWVKFTSAAGGKKSCTFSNTQTQETILKKKFKLEFAVDPEFMKKLEEANAILSKKYPEGVPFEKLFEVMLDEYLEKHSPKRKIRRREKRKADKKKSGVNKRSRHIPEAVQDQVFTRDNGRCTYKGPGGRMCNSTWNLEIDHILPFARGGDHTIQNLRLLCAKHNHLEAERVYGREFMDGRMYRAKHMRE
jgi:5-methylcytosine-specific restriction endonuclease McrA